MQELSQNVLFEIKCEFMYIYFYIFHIPMNYRVLNERGAVSRISIIFIGYS